MCTLDFFMFRQITWELESKCGRNTAPCIIKCKLVNFPEDITSKQEENINTSMHQNWEQQFL